MPNFSIEGSQIRIVKYRKLERGQHHTEYCLCNVTFDPEMMPTLAFPVITAAEGVRDLKTLIVEYWGAVNLPTIEFPDVVNMDNHKHNAFPLKWKLKSSRSKKQPIAH